MKIRDLKGQRGIPGCIRILVASTLLVTLAFTHTGCSSDDDDKTVHNGEPEGIYIGTTSYNGLQAALEAAKGTTATIVVNNYQNGAPFSFSYTVPPNTHITIEGKGSCEQFLSSTSTGFTLNNANSSLTLSNITIKRSTVKIINGTFTMLSGAKIINNERDGANGGGVDMSGGTFIMKGGEITNNMSTADPGSGYNPVNRTGRGGGVCMGGGTFTMEGGEIHKNAATYTGGLYIAGGSFIMKGGRIHSNASIQNTSHNLFILTSNDVQQGTAVYGDGTPILEAGSNGTGEDITGRAK